MILGTLAGSRPKLLVFDRSTNILVRDLLLHSSPSFHLLLDSVAEVEVDNVTVITDRHEMVEAKALMRARQQQQQLLQQQQHAWLGVKVDGAGRGADPEPGLEPLVCGGCSSYYPGRISSPILASRLYS